jgi:DNA primase
MLKLEPLFDEVDLLRLAELAGARVKRSGKVHQSACPLHGGDNPTAFNIYVDDDCRQRWHCFTGCQAGGDAIDFVQRWKGLDWIEAVKWLADYAQIPMAELGWSSEAVEEHQRQIQVHDLLARAAQFFQKRLWSDDPRAMAALEKGARDRGFSDEHLQAATWGFSTSDDALLKAMLAAEDSADLVPLARKVGLIRADGRDFTANASGHEVSPDGWLIYPHIHRGKTVYLSARALSPVERGSKSRNLPVTPLAPRQIYRADLGLDGRPLERHGDLVIVEGPADAETVRGWGWPAWALMGCTLNEERNPALVEVLQRKAEQHTVYIALSNDEEGQKGAAKAAEIVGPLARMVRWPKLKGANKSDANDWLRQGATAEDAAALFEASPTYLDEQIEQVAAMRDVRERAEGIERLAELVNRLSETQQRLYLRIVGDDKRLGIGVREFGKLLKGHQLEEEGSGLMKEVVTAGGYAGEQLFELVVTADDQPRSLFVVRHPNGQLGMAPFLEIGGVRYLPISPDDDLISKQVVLFPTALGDYTDERALQAGIQDFIHTYLDVDLFYEKMACYYVMLTWVYDCFDILPYLRALGDYGTGKTRFLQVIGSICYRPMFLGGASTTSPIFRMIDVMRGTLVLDEADFQMSDAEADIVKILNTGYMKGFPVLRSERDGGDNFVVKALDVYGPKIIATRKRYRDKALESRMLTKEMSGIPRADIPIVLPKRFWSEAQKLRNKLLRYRLQTWQPDIEVNDDDIDRSIEPRLNQVTVSLKTIVGDEGLQEDITEFTREYNRQVIVDRSMTLAATILSVIVQLHKEPVQYDLNGNPVFDLSIKTITRRVNLALAEEDETSGEEQAARKLTSKKIGYEIRERLQLRTEKKRSGYYTVWDDRRIEALCQRFGISDGDVGGER